MGTEKKAKLVSFVKKAVCHESAQRDWQGNTCAVELRLNWRFA